MEPSDVADADKDTASVAQQQRSKDASLSQRTSSVEEDVAECAFGDNDGPSPGTLAMPVTDSEARADVSGSAVGEQARSLQAVEENDGGPVPAGTSSSASDQRESFYRSCSAEPHAESVVSEVNTGASEGSFHEAKHGAEQETSDTEGGTDMAEQAFVSKEDVHDQSVAAKRIAAQDSSEEISPFQNSQTREAAEQAIPEEGGDLADAADQQQASPLVANQVEELEASQANPVGDMPLDNKIASSHNTGCALDFDGQESGVEWGESDLQQAFVEADVVEATLADAGLVESSNVAGLSVEDDNQEVFVEADAVDSDDNMAASASAGSSSDDFADFAEVQEPLPSSPPDHTACSNTGQYPSSALDARLSSKEPSVGEGDDDFGDFGDFSEAPPDAVTEMSLAAPSLEPVQRNQGPPASPAGLLDLSETDFLTAAAALLACLTPPAAPGTYQAVAAASSLTALAEAYPRLRQDSYAVRSIAVINPEDQITAAAAATHLVRWKGSRSEARFLQRLGLDGVEVGAMKKAKQHPSGSRMVLQAEQDHVTAGVTGGAEDSNAVHGSSADPPATQEQQQGHLQHGSIAALQEAYSLEGTGEVEGPQLDAAPQAEGGWGQDGFNPFGDAGGAAPEAPPGRAASQPAYNSGPDPFAASVAFEDSFAMGWSASTPAEAHHLTQQGSSLEPAGTAAVALGATTATLSLSSRPTSQEEQLQLQQDQGLESAGVEGVSGGSTTSTAPAVGLATLGAAAWEGNASFIESASTGQPDLLGGPGWGDASVASKPLESSAPVGTMDWHNTAVLGSQKTDLSGSNSVTSGTAGFERASASASAEVRATGMPDSWMGGSAVTSGLTVGQNPGIDAEHAAHNAAGSDDDWGDFGAAPPAIPNGSSLVRQDSGQGEEDSAENRHQLSLHGKGNKLESSKVSSASPGRVGARELADAQNLVSQLPDLSFMFQWKE